MASLSLIRAHFHALGHSAKSLAASAAHPFTDQDWQRERSIREALDSLLWPIRWQVRIVLAGDPTPRTYFLRGTHASVCRRANALFSAPHIAVVTPAHVQQAPEWIDRRLSLSTTTGEVTC